VYKIKNKNKNQMLSKQLLSKTLSPPFVSWSAGNLDVTIVPFWISIKAVFLLAATLRNPAMPPESNTAS